jgi:hypothetical protein
MIATYLAHFTLPYLMTVIVSEPVSIAESSKASTVYNRLNIGIAGSNPVLCCPVSVETLRRADPPAKESYRMSLYVDREAH